ncbi:MAG: 3-oxoacyl-[acyl-carrier-protein] synthase III C-terminal domain-containing protein [Dehalococcoidia bacterium]|nr:3-oxoacyl-[acyl-carrier-protein] synthase III C-terminal domain-containing protein [Dehalococcoidia bacterium]
MVGIVSFGAYVPIYRLSREAIGQMWNKGVGKGEKAVANADEDSVTMGVEAVIDCLRGMDRNQVDGLYFATNSPPYIEKQSASIIRAAADLREDILTFDVAHSLRGAGSAMKAAADAVKAGSAKKVLVAASERRIPPPNSDFELQFGDGAAAFLIGDTDVAAELEGSYHLTAEFIDTWRKPEDTYVLTWEDRFIRDEAYMKMIPQAVDGLLKKLNLTPKDITKAAFYAADSRTHTAIAGAMRLDPKTQVQNPLLDNLGNTGAALAPMILAAALEEAKAGDRILFATYGDGADAFMFRVTEQIEKIRDRRGIKRHVASKMMLPNYGKYVEIRELMEWESPRRGARRSSLPVLWRERKMLYALYGQKCRSCGNIQYPRQRICIYCQAKDNFDPIRLSDKTGKVFTFSMDQRAQEIVLPKVFTVVNLDGGGRFYSVMTDRDTSKITVGMPVEMTFRIQMGPSGNLPLEGSGLYNYFWRVRPIRC